jgi:ketosteroid isomerase-like protein
MNLEGRILVSTLNRNQNVKGKCQMNKKKACVAFIVLLTCALAGQALAQGQEIEYKSNAEDLTKIRSVLEEFRQDIIHKDGYAITKLMLNPDVLFHHINNQEEVDSARKYNAQFDGIGPSQLDGFAKLLATSKDKLEEKFHNIEIRQDGDLGLVTFNYDLSSTTRFTIQASKSGSCAKLMGSGRSCPLPGRSIFTADSQQRSREQDELA